MTTINHTAHSSGEALTSTLQNAPLAQIDQAIEDLRYSAQTIVTLASDVCTSPTLSGKSGKGVYNLIVAAQTGTSDDLIEVTGISVGDVVLLRADTGDTITVKHNSGSATIKIFLAGDADIVLDEDNPLVLYYVETNVLSQIFSGSVSVSSKTIGSYTLTGNLDTTSSTYADIDSTNIKQDVTITNGQAVRSVFVIPAVRILTSGTGTFKLIANDGSDNDPDTLVEPTITVTGSGSEGWVRLQGEWTGLAAGTVTVKPQFKVSANTCRVTAGYPCSWEVEVI